MVPTQSCNQRFRDVNKLQNKLKPESALPDLSGHKYFKTIKKSLLMEWIYKTQIHLYLGPNS